MMSKRFETEVLDMDSGEIKFEFPKCKEKFYRALLDVLDDFRPNFVTEEFTEELDKDNRIGFRIFTYKDGQKYGYEVVVNTDNCFALETQIRMGLESVVEEMYKHE